MRLWSRRLNLLMLALLVLVSCGRQGVLPAEEADLPRTLTNHTITDQVLEMLLENSTDGTVGLYLKEVGGPVLANFNESFQFEPASSIKALIHFHAMRQVQEGTVIGGQAVTLERQVPWFTDFTATSGSCPNLTGAASDTLEEGLFRMMVNSDNRWTQAMRDFFGDGSINDTRSTLEMSDTVLTHLIGCFGSTPPDGFTNGINNPNQLTLVDAGKMYEAVATGFLNQSTRDDAFNLMLSGANNFTAIIDQETVGLGLSSNATDGFKMQRQSALKGGSYGWSDPVQHYRSQAGWASLAFKDADCSVSPREFVFGVFIHNATTAAASSVVQGLAIELFRGQIRLALESWAACEADLEIISSSIVDPPAEVDVNTAVTLTVRHLVRNNGPAATINAKVTTVATAPDDCTLTPGDVSQEVLGLVLGVVGVVEEEIELTCSEPSSHEFKVDAEISPLNLDVVDPDASNNEVNTAATIAMIAYADLAIADWDLSELDNAGIQDFLVEQPFIFETPKVLRNYGDTEKGTYDTPVNATVTVTMEIPAGIRGSIKDGNITAWIDGPSTISRDVKVAQLKEGVDQDIIETFGIRCLEPGQYTIMLRNEIWADDEHILDPDESNNVLEVERVIECVLPVQINIRPGNAHNFVNPNSNQSVPIAILTTEKGEYNLPLDFDATTINHATVRFGTAEMLNNSGGTAASPDRDFIRDSFEMDDKTKDGDLDMVLLFRVPGSGISTQTTEACLVGTYLGGDATLYTFFGCDAVHIIGPGS